MKQNNLKQILQEVEYGKIKINLDKIMKDRNITTYQLNNKTNIRFQTIQALRDNLSSRIDFNVLAKLCYSLNCKIEDIIEYIPNNE